MIRVVGGVHRSRKLKQPSKSITRPTMDRVKEAIFNVLQFKIKDSIVLDLFAGSGSLGIEAISRGAMKVIAIDKSQEAIDVLRDNINSLKINNLEIIKSDVVNYVEHSYGTKFDYIFMDPPFANFNIYNEVLSFIDKNKLLKDEGLIILETKNPLKITIPKGFVIQKQKKYGVSHVLMLANII